jgi:hypothetical protein
METFTGKLNDTKSVYMQVCKRELIFSLNVEVEEVEPRILYTLTLSRFDRIKSVYVTKEFLYKQTFEDIKLLINFILELLK